MCIRLCPCLLLLTAFVLAGCADELLSAHALEGVWVREQDGVSVHLSFQPGGSWGGADGGTFRVEQDSLGVVATGTYTASLNVLTFTDTGCQHAFQPVPGQYRMQVTAERLHLAPLDDTCTGRRATLVGSWRPE